MCVWIHLPEENERDKIHGLGGLGRKRGKRRRPTECLHFPSLCFLVNHDVKGLAPVSWETEPPEVMCKISLYLKYSDNLVSTMKKVTDIETFTKGYWSIIKSNYFYLSPSHWTRWNIPIAWGGVCVTFLSGLFSHIYGNSKVTNMQ